VLIGGRKSWSQFERFHSPSAITPTETIEKAALTPLLLNISVFSWRLRTCDSFFLLIVITAGKLSSGIALPDLSI
jgi:hypothetical protein